MIARALPALLTAALALGACETVPRPFRHQEGMLPALARPKLERGIALRGDEALLWSGPLAEALADAFAAQEVALTLRPGPGFGRVIEVGGGAGQDLTWRMLAADGGELTRFATAPAGDADGARQVAAQVAARLLPLLDDPDARPQPAEGGMPPPMRVRLESVKGLPGDGDEALPKAFVRALERQGVRIDEAADYTVVCVFSLVSGGGTEDTVRLSWRLRRDSAAGAQLASIDQVGTVPRGRLDLQWGSLARDIAEGGASGVAQSVRRFAREQGGDHPSGSRRFTEPGATGIGGRDSSDKIDPPRPGSPAASEPLPAPSPP